MITLNHQLPDLIWNERTRLELRIALEYEMKAFDKEQRLKKNKKVAWNYQQFQIIYESLKDEMQVGPIYIRHFLEAGDSFFRSLENPSPLVLFEKLFRRVLVNGNNNSSLSIVCTRSLIRLYYVCWDSIGVFDDMLLIVKMLNEANNIELQHCLLDFLELLSTEENNLLQLLDGNFVNSIIKYASLAHLNPDQIGNVLARLTNNVLMIKSEDVRNTSSASSSSSSSSSFQTQNDSTSNNIKKKSNDNENQSASQVQQKQPVQPRSLSLWIPDDISCPSVWFVAPPVPQGRGMGIRSIPPINTQKGPFRVSELKEMLDRCVGCLLNLLTSLKNLSVIHEIFKYRCFHLLIPLLSIGEKLRKIALLPPSWGRKTGTKKDSLLLLIQEDGEI